MVRTIIVGSSGVTRRLDNTTWTNGSIAGNSSLMGVYAKRDISIEEGSGVVIAVGGDHVYRSTDHGVNWTLVESVGNGAVLFDVINVPGTQIWHAVGYAGVAYKSFNDGLDWVPSASGTDNTLNAVHVTSADQEKVWLGGFGGTIRYSTTHGD